MVDNASDGLSGARVRRILVQGQVSSSVVVIVTGGADAVRQTRQHDQRILCGSSRSTFLRIRFAKVNERRSGDLECRSIEPDDSLRLHKRQRIEGTGIKPYSPAKIRRSMALKVSLSADAVAGR
jgi:hypothetical protein